MIIQHRVSLSRTVSFRHFPVIIDGVWCVFSYSFFPLRPPNPLFLFVFCFMRVHHTFICQPLSRSWSFYRIFVASSSSWSWSYYWIFVASSFRSCLWPPLLGPGPFYRIFVASFSRSWSSRIFVASFRIVIDLRTFFCRELLSPSFACAMIVCDMLFSWSIFGLCRSSSSIDAIHFGLTFTGYWRLFMRWRYSQDADFGLSFVF